MSYSSGTEHLIVNELRKTQKLTLSIVAITEDEIVGHRAVSPIEVSSDAKGWYGLGPVSVLPTSQRRGIGSQLINYALNLLKYQNSNGCVLIGSPQYYSRFGFKTTNDLIYPDVPPEYFQILPFRDHVPSGTIKFDNAFNIKI